jgi:hypothetical protein
MVRGLKRLEINEDGEFTLEGKVVQPIPLGPPFLTFYEASFGDGRSVTSSFDRVYKRSALKPEELPVHTQEMLYFSERSNAFMMSPEAVREVEYQKQNRGIWIKDWVAIQFYKITEE